MTTLIAFYHGKKYLGACTTTCYDSKNPTCNCICQGTNHGIGSANAHRHAKGVLYLLMKHPNDVVRHANITAVEYNGNRYDLLHRTLSPIEET